MTQPQLFTTPTPSILCPFRVIIDTREQYPYAFANLRTDARQRYRPLIVDTSAAALFAGDYSIEGWEDRIAVERKSKEDLFSTFVSDRERGEEQLKKLSHLQVACVVVEAGMESVLEGPDRKMSKEMRQRQRKTMFRSLIAWQQRFPMVHWQFMPRRDWAEIYTFRFLERFYLDVVNGKR